MTSPTQRALAHCREQGWTVAITEHWNSYAKIRQDLFGCLDLIVLDGKGGGPLGVQVTSGSNVAARLTKSKAEPRLRSWLKSPARFEVWGYRQAPTYRKDGSKGVRKKWVLRVVPISLDDCAIEEVSGHLPSEAALD